ncbi:MAG: hypothetical protein II232_00005, partial [Spirochaetaceae bacterium]|nr:hypothetical protein [Spirochaetaceae bacterium]
KLGCVPVIQNMTSNNAVITYNIKNVAEVNYIFSFVSSETGMFTEDSDLVVVDILVKNISKKTNVYSLRGVFDTIFGENTISHFSTSNMNSINSEVLFNTMYVDRWIKSSDGINSIKFLLDGETITHPSSVVVANRDILKVDSWLPKIVPGRGFNSLFLINDSAVGVTWGNYKVASGQTFGVRFYISGATGTVEPSDVTSNFFTSGKALQSASFVAESDKLIAEEVIEYVVVSTEDEAENDKKDKSKNKGKNEEEQEEVVSVSEGSEKVENNEEIVEDVQEDIVEEVEEDFVESEPIEEDFTFEESTDDSLANDTTDVEYQEDVSYDEGNLPYVEITPDKLNLDYVAELIKEIEELEKNPELYDAVRILYLHTELDAILEILEQ